MNDSPDIHMICVCFGSSSGSGRNIRILRAKVGILFVRTKVGQDGRCRCCMMGGCGRNQVVVGGWWLVSIATCKVVSKMSPLSSCKGM